MTLAYTREPVVRDLSLAVPDGRVTSIIGPNGCGKSTLLRALARLLRPRGGTVLLDGQAIHHRSTKAVARELGLLPQQAPLPEAVAVESLVRRGRYPHLGLFQSPTRQDEAAVERALDLAGVADLRHRPVDELSGGQRQRVWLALALAQDTPVLLLDEPTTFLDIAHAVETLDLVRALSDRDGRTVVLVLHDLGQACRYADHVVALRDGRVVAAGAPREVVTAELVHQVFGVPSAVVPDPLTGTPLVLPAGDAPAPVPESGPGG